MVVILKFNETDLFRCFRTTEDDLMRFVDSQDFDLISWQGILKLL